MMLMLLVAGCSTVKLIDSDRAICDGLDPLVDSHVEALLVDGGPKSLLTGDRLVSGFDAGCMK
jgi:hypothetical protein